MVIEKAVTPKKFKNYRGKAPDDAEGEVIRAGREAAELLAQQARQHGDDRVYQIDAGAPLQGARWPRY